MSFFILGKAIHLNLLIALLLVSTGMVLVNRHSASAVSLCRGWKKCLAFRRRKVYIVAMRLRKLGAHAKKDLKVRAIWVPRDSKKVLTGPVAVRTRYMPRQIAMEYEIEIISDKAASDHIHMFLSYRLTQNINKVMHWLKGIGSHILL